MSLATSSRTSSARNACGFNIVRSPRLRYCDGATRRRRRRLPSPRRRRHGAHGRRRAESPHEENESEAVPHLEGRLGIRDVETVRQGARARALAVLHRRALQPRSPLAEAARALRGPRPHRAPSPDRGARAHPRGAQRRRHAPGSGGGDLPDGHLRRHAGRRRRAGGLRAGPGRARRALPGRRAREVSDAALAAAVDAARAAGRVALKYYNAGFEIALKPDATPVTQADREAERTIVEILGRAFPEHGFLGEEFGGSGNAATRWIIDPIDGTKNFVRRIPIWATLIALEEHGEITVGVIHNPVTGELYTARRGGGAFLNGERLRVSDEADLSQAYLLHAGRPPRPRGAAADRPAPRDARRGASSARLRGPGARRAIRARARRPPARMAGALRGRSAPGPAGDRVDRLARARLRGAAHRARAGLDRGPVGRRGASGVGASRGHGGRGRGTRRPRDPRPARGARRAPRRGAPRARRGRMEWERSGAARTSRGRGAREAVAGDGIRRGARASRDIAAPRDRSPSGAGRLRRRGGAPGAPDGTGHNAPGAAAPAPGGHLDSRNGLSRQRLRDQPPGRGCRRSLDRALRPRAADAAPVGGARRAGGHLARGGEIRRHARDSRAHGLSTVRRRC